MMNKQDKIITGLIILILFIVWSKFMVASGYAGTTPITTAITSYPISLGKDIVLANWQVVAGGVGTPSSGVTVASNPLGDSTVSNNQLFDAQLAPAAQFNLQWGDVNRQCWSDLNNATKIIGFRKELKSGGGGKLWYLYSTDGKMPATGNQAQTAVAKTLFTVGSFSIPQYLIATKSRESPLPDGNCTYRIVAAKSCSQTDCQGGLGTQSQILQLIKKADPGGTCVAPDGTSDLTLAGAAVLSITAAASAFKAASADSNAPTATTQTTAELTTAVPTYVLGYFDSTATEGSTCLMYASPCAGPGCKGGINFIQNSGMVQTIAGTAGNISTTGTDGAGATGSPYSLAPTFYTPSAICVGGGASANVYVLDSGSGSNNKIRYLYANTDALWQTLTIPTFAPQSGNNFKGIGCDPLMTTTASNVYVSESGTGASRVSQVTPAGVSSFLAITGNPILGAVYVQGGNASGPVSTGGGSNVWVTAGNNILLLRYAANGVLVGGNQYLQTLTSESSPPTSIVTIGTNVYYTVGHCIKKFPMPNGAATQTVTPTVVAGAQATSAGYTGSEVGSAARFNNPSGLCADLNGNLYVADNGNNVIRKIDGTGTVTVFVGGGQTPAVSGGTAIVGTVGSADTTISAATAAQPGGGATFSGPKGTAIDTNGNIFVADTANNIIRRIV